MCESYARSLLRVSVAQVCQAVGWDAVQLSACDLLSDVLERYLQQLARSCHRYSELYGRTDPGLSDVDQAFGLLGVSIAELEDYVNNMEPVGFPQTIPQFPISKSSVLQFPAAGFETDAREALRGERRDYIPEYFPPLWCTQEPTYPMIPQCCSPSLSPHPAHISHTQTHIRLLITHSGGSARSRRAVGLQPCVCEKLAEVRPGWQTSQVSVCERESPARAGGLTGLGASAQLDAPLPEERLRISWRPYYILPRTHAANLHVHL
ncbi:Transcription initiation factor TFIID subunit 3 [Labeo rohita]|uniref:Transcription initiation factor TFIID subunit 3 n=1 Tax=Labeo rohita TaxID=84645 RepID=A0ABQ8MRG0_LABRO|nr:Transcription initiation factor TFIID subunit 3 [Labeo rohita]